MTRLRSLLLTSALCASLTPGLAAADDFARFGPYLGLNAAYGFPLFEEQLQDALGPILGPDTQLDASWGLNTRLGLRLLSFLAVEAQYEWMDNFQIKPSAPGIPDVQLSGNIFTGNLKLYIPIRRVQPYLLAGFGFAMYDAGGAADDMFFAGRVGGGLDVYLTKHWALNAEATALLTASDLGEIGGSTEALDGLHYVSASLGLMYRF